jgi:hypothetical protein
VTSVAEWTSSTAAAARTAVASTASGPAASSTSSGRSRLPPAAIVDRACSARTSPCDDGHRRQDLLDARQQRRDVRPAGRDDVRDRSVHAAGTRPWCMAMMPPA